MKRLTSHKRNNWSLNQSLRQMCKPSSEQPVKEGIAQAVPAGTNSRKAKEQCKKPENTKQKQTS